ncbi:MAG: NAD(P)H-dependent oxidoreductase [Rhodothermia bacterium]|nr:NAD(P)H-dependent oxidoreductase [Rhodothermia bacterium]
MVRIAPGEGATTILGIAGSLRRSSINRALLEATRDLAPKNTRVEIAEIAGIPLYNQDLDNDRDRPLEVSALKSAVADADAVLIATPEYNFGVPGVLKNVIDWVSRPAMRSPLAHKPVGIIGASPGALGTARAQEQLKTIMLSTLAVLFPHPGVLVGGAGQKFEDGQLVDDETAAFLSDYMKQLSEWLRKTESHAHAA